MKIWSRFLLSLGIVFCSAYVSAKEITPDMVVASLRVKSIKELAPRIRTALETTLGKSRAQESIFPFFDVLCSNDIGLDDANAGLYAVKVAAADAARSDNQLALLATVKVRNSDALRLLLKLSQFSHKRIGEWVFFSRDQQLISSLESVDWITKDIGKPFAGDVICDIDPRFIAEEIEFLLNHHLHPVIVDNPSTNDQKMDKLLASGFQRAARAFRQMEQISFFGKWAADKLLLSARAKAMPGSKAETIINRLSKPRTSLYDIGQRDDFIAKFNINISPDCHCWNWIDFDKLRTVIYAVAGESLTEPIKAVMDSGFDDMKLWSECFQNYLSGDIFAITTDNQEEVAFVGLRDIVGKDIGFKQAFRENFSAFETVVIDKIEEYRDFDIYHVEMAEKLRNFLCQENPLPTVIKPRTSYWWAVSDEVYIMGCDCANTDIWDKQFLHNFIDSYFNESKTRCVTVGDGMLREYQVDIGKIMRIISKSDKFAGISLKIKSLCSAQNGTILYKLKVKNKEIYNFISAFQAFQEDMQSKVKEAKE